MQKPKGGARQGAGRKPKADEERVKNLALKAIRSCYGSEDKGFLSLLRSLEPSLIKFVFEHAYGKPKDNLNVKADIGITWKEEKTYAPEPKAN